MTEDKSIEEIDMNKVEDAVEPKAEIIRGRMPLALVFTIRFRETGGTSAIADKYRTTQGKVDDIQKMKNFKYIDEDFKVDAEMIASAQTRCDDLKDGAEIMVAVNAIGTSEAAKDELAAKRAATRPAKKEVEKPAENTVEENPLSDEELLEDLPEEAASIPEEEVMPDEEVKELDFEDDISDILGE